MRPEILQQRVLAALQREARVFAKVVPVTARVVRVVEMERELIQVCSTQYLGRIGQTVFESQVRKSERLAQEMSSLGSNFLAGTHPSRIRLENGVARLVNRAKGLAFASGWAANYGVCEALGSLCDLIVSDKRNHNSVIHGLRGISSEILVADMNDEATWAHPKLVSAEVVGIIHPTLEGITGESVIPSIPMWLRDKSIWITDESHSFGAVGSSGTEDFEGLMADVRIAGLSKACGVMGSVACGPSPFIDLVSQVASPWTFSTAVPPLIWTICSGVTEKLDALRQARQKILELALLLRKRLTMFGIEFSGQHHITGIRLPAAIDPHEVETRLEECGFFARVSQYPSRPPDAPCMRVCFTPEHEVADAMRLASCLDKLELAKL